MKLEEPVGNSGMTNCDRYFKLNITLK